MLGFILQASFALGADAPPAADLYVSPQSQDAWSGTLAAPNAARTDGPLASLAGARDAIRRRKAAGPLAAPIRVLVRGGWGTYRQHPRGWTASPRCTRTTANSLRCARSPSWPGEAGHRTPSAVGCRQMVWFGKCAPCQRSKFQTRSGDKTSRVQVAARKLGRSDLDAAVGLRRGNATDRAVSLEPAPHRTTRRPARCGSTLECPP